MDHHFKAAVITAVFFFFVFYANINPRYQAVARDTSPSEVQSIRVRYEYTVPFDPGGELLFLKFLFKSGGFCELFFF